MPHCNKKMISFFLTTKCNLCCRYCYNAEERNEIKEQTIPLDVAKAAIDWYFSNDKSRHIRFYGPGEPTQEFEKMKEITKYAKSHSNGGDKVTVEIQTNGIFTPDVREWILNNVNIIWMSFDGMKDIQNHNRPLNPNFSHIFSYKTCGDILEENVLWLNKNKKDRDLMVGARVTITDVNVDQQKEMVDYFYNLGIQFVWTDPILYEVKKESVHPIKNNAGDLQEYEQKYEEDFHFSMNTYLNKYLVAYKYAKSIGLFWGSFFAINFDGSSSYHCRSCTPLQAPHITPDGYISACDMVVLGEKPYHMAPLIVGKWDSELRQFTIFDEKVKILMERKSNQMFQCMDCEAKLHCGGYCLGETLNETGSLNGYNPLKCNSVRKLFSELGTCNTYPYLHP